MNKILNRLSCFYIICVMLIAFGPEAKAQRNQTIGAAQTFNSVKTSNVRVVPLDDSHIFVLYKDGSTTAASDLYGRVGEVDTLAKTVTFGAATLIESASMTKPAVLAMSSSRVVVFYESDLTNDIGVSRVITVDTSSDAITDIGRAVEFSAGDIDAAGSHNMIPAVKLTRTTFAVVYSDDESTDDGTVKIGTVSGTSVNYGPEQKWSTGDVEHMSVTALTSSKIAIAWKDDGTVNGPGKVIVGDVAGTNVNFGSDVTFHSAGVSATEYTAIAAISSDQFIVAYTDGADLDYGKAKVGTVSGTVVTMSSSAFAFESTQDTRDITIAYLDGDEVIIGYNGGPSDKARAYTAEASGAGTSASIIFGNSPIILAGEGDDSWLAAFNANSFVMGYVDESNADDHGEMVVGTVPGIYSPVGVSITNTTAVDCNGAATGSLTATATPGVANYTYLWSNGFSSPGSTSLTSTNSSLPAGTYTVTVTDGNGNTAVASSLITQPTAIGVSITAQTNVDCNGSTTGSATAAGSGGTEAYTYAWSNSATTASITGVGAGTYTVSITDANGCGPTTAEIMITEPTAIGASITAQTNIDCNGSTTGSATAAGSGGTEAYTYAWSNSATTASITGVGAGTYTVSITDANGCGPTTAEVMITEPTAMSVTIATDNNISGNGLSDGGLTANPTGGTTTAEYKDVGRLIKGSGGPYFAFGDGMKFSVLANSVTIDFVTIYPVGTGNVVVRLLSSSGTPLDFTTVAVTGGTGAAVRIPVDLTVAKGTDYMLDAVGTTGISLFRSTSGSSFPSNDPSNSLSITATINGFAGFWYFYYDWEITVNTDYTYSWSNSASTKSLTGLAAGTYTVSITDANGCGPETAEVTITADVTGPLLVSSNPADDADSFTGTTIGLNFDETIVKGSGGVGVFNAADDSQIAVFGVGSPRVTVSGSTATIDLVKALPLETQVYVRIQAGAFTDVAGNDFAGILNNTTLNFASPTIPVLTASTPMDDATDFVGTTMTLTFDRNMVKGSGRISITDGEGDFLRLGVANSRVSITDNVVTIDLVNPLPRGNRMFVRIPASAFKDANDVFYPGILDNSTLNFETATEPELVSTNPGDEATEFGGTTLVFTFDSNVSKGTGRISVLDASNDSEIAGAGVASGRVTIADNVVTLDLINALPKDKDVYVNIPASAFKDANDFFYGGILNKTTLNFSSQTTPSLVSSLPADDAVDFDGSTITLTFDRNMVKGTGRVSVMDAADDTELASVAVGNPRVSIADKVVTINLARALPTDKMVYLSVPRSAFKDASNAFYEGILDKTTLNFATNIGLNLLSTNPVDNSTNFTGTSITFTFNRDVIAGSGRLELIQTDSDEVITSAGVSSSRVTIAGASVTFDLNGALPVGLQVYVKIPRGAFKDVNDLLYAGILDKTTLNFNTFTLPSEANLINLTGDLNAVSTLSIYPNPAVREITIGLSGMGEESSVRILSIDGVVKLTKKAVKTPSLRVDVSRYAQGVYIVTAQNKVGQMVYKKFVIKK